jgi:hypothetical protein
MSEVTYTLNPGEYRIIQIFSEKSTGIISIAILSANGTATVQSCMESVNFFSLASTSITDPLWENIQISGVSTASITSNVLSQAFMSPTMLKIQNTSPGSQQVRFAIRVND